MSFHLIIIFFYMADPDPHQADTDPHHCLEYSSRKRLKDNRQRKKNNNNKKKKKVKKKIRSMYRNSRNK